MYRQGLGDCFLLTFFPGGDEKHVLIDCGTLGSKYTDVKLPDVIAELDKTTNGHLDLVIATHQHQDHLSGFSRLSTVFSAPKKQIDNVWLAWTEDPKDPDAKKLTKARNDMGIAVRSAMQALKAVNPDSETAKAMDSLLGFFGDNSVLPAASGGAEGAIFAAAARDSMEIARGLAKKPAFLSPGDPVIEPDWLPGFRFYVLGPPRSIDAIHDTGEHGSSELYALTAFSSAALQLAAKASKKQEECDDVEAMDPPFDRRFRLKRTDPRIAETLGSTYLAKSECWRSVDEDWLNAASSLAIKLDSFTNNTSLVLAIERVADGKVLLFPGDAQEGNWVSWHDAGIKWEVTRGDGESASVTAKDLLARTVFYKVGHHSSHNATAKAKGLEMMTSQSELTAFIPVDRQIALGRSPKGSWKMPARQLYRRLLEQCDGRVVRSDLGWAAGKQGDRTTESEFVGLGKDAEWARWTKSQGAAGHVQIAPTYVEFMLV
jgi:metallo-beta-lactamase superfamily protein